MQVSNKEADENSPIDCTKRSSLSESENQKPEGGEFVPDIHIDAQSEPGIRPAARTICTHDLPPIT